MKTKIEITLFMISRSVTLKSRSVSGKICKENQNNLCSTTTQSDSYVMRLRL